ncbi:MAG: serpin family protein, partial [Planctomycetaceae bacterium]|nr:serpin family protein [Planctomycetaceae bacterium]
MKPRHLITIGIACLFFVALAAGCFRSPSHTEKRFEQEIIPGRLPPKTFHQSAKDFNRFAIETYLAAVREKPEENAVFSPLCFSNSLEVLLTASRGDTATEIRNILHLPKTNEIEPQNEPLFEYVPPPRAKTLMRQNLDYPPFFISAQSLWVSDKLKVSKDFLRRNKRNYFLELFSVDFQKDAAAIGNNMNAWADIKTQGLIPN